jgi:hypothetical protein
MLAIVGKEGRKVGRGFVSVKSTLMAILLLE